MGITSQPTHGRLNWKQSTPHGSTLGSGQPGSSREQGQEEGEGEVYVDLLDEEEALELVQFEPAVDEEDTWNVCETINSFIKKAEILSTTRDGILKDYPKPRNEALFAPKFDEDVKKQIEKAGKDPHYGIEKHLYNLQRQILDISSPLTCLWADLLNHDATVSHKDMILLLQGALTLLGSASHTITQERRRVAWSRVNPSIGALPEDKGENPDKVKEITLFSGGFLETEQPGNPTLAVVLGKESVHHSKISSWGGQLCGRRGIQGDSVNCRVAITPADIPADPRNSWQLQYRPVCNLPQCSAETVCELETRP